MIDLQAIKDKVPRLDFKLPNGELRQVLLTGPIAAAFLRDARKATGLDKVTREQVASWEKDPKAAVEFWARQEPNEAAMVAAVDALVTRDAPELRGQLPLDVYGKIFFEAMDKITASCRQEGDASAESKKAASSPR